MAGVGSSNLLPPTIILLKETFSSKDIIAIVAGFTGAIIILKPESSLFHYRSLLVIVSTVLWAWNNLIAKQLTKHDDFVVINFFTWGFIAILSLPTLIFYWQPINFLHIISFLVMVVSLTAFLILAIMAFSYADLVTLAPFWFTRTIFVASFSFMFFNQLP